MVPSVRIVGLLLSLALASIGAASGLVVDYPPLDGNVAHEDALLHYTNLERTRAGLADLRRDDALTLAARHHAAEMARLQYMSHESPVAANATVLQRAARAGSPARTLGENLARVGHDGASARTAVGGWMDSAGHRANLLNPKFSHVGFGTAVNGRGELYVVQVLAGQPLRILGATVRPHLVETPRVEVSFDLLVPSDVALGYGESYLPLQSLQPGRHTMAFPYSSAEPVHVRAGVRPYAGTGGFVGQDGGWFEPGGGGWSPSGTFPRSDLRIVSVVARTLREPMNRVVLTLERSEPTDVGVWIDGAWADDVRMDGEHLLVDVPSHLVQAEIAIGTEVPGEDGRYAMALGLTLRNGAGVLQLHPSTR